MYATNPRPRRRALTVLGLAVAMFAAWLAYGAGTANAAYAAKVKGGTLTITGNGASDKLVLRLRAGSPTILELDVGANGTADFSFDRNKFTSIDVEAGRGDDEVRIDNTSGAFADEELAIDGGADADTLLGGFGAETLRGGTGNDVVDGGAGSDRLFLGDGNDRLLWSPGDGSDTVEGGLGSDQLAVFGNGGSETIQLLANGGRARFTRDIGNVALDLNDIETVDYDAAGGADAITVADLAPTDVRTVDLDLNAFGGGADGQLDSVVVNGTELADTVSVVGAGAGIGFAGLAALTRVEGGEAIDEITFAGRGGADNVAMTVGVSGADNVNIDGGDGADRMQYNGSAGGDQIGVIANGLEVSTTAPATARLDTIRVEDLAVNGLAGSDEISAVGNLAPLAKLSFDGGEDGDVIRGGNGVDLLLGGAGNDALDGNQGNDAVFLGSGEDRFQWDPGDGSDTVEGQEGNDLIDFFGSNANEKIKLAANGGRALLTRDIAAITLDTDTLEHFAVHALGGTDTIETGELLGTDLTTIDADLGALNGTPDGLTDIVTVNGTDAADSFGVAGAAGMIAVAGPVAVTRVEGADAFDEITLATRDGADVVTATVGIPGVTPVNVDSGEGLDEVRYNGTTGHDVIDVVANGTEVSVVEPATARIDALSVERIVVLGHAGEDTFSAVGNLAALTALTFEGGEDGDVLRGGNGADVILGGGGNDALDGNQGSDVVDGGDGEDRFQWNPGDGIDVVEGGAGSDLLDFFGSGANEKINLAANGDRVVLTRDIAAITLDIGDVEHVAVFALGGADMIETGNLAGSDLTTIDVGLGAFGGGADGQLDSVVVNGTELADTVSVVGAGAGIGIIGLAALTRVEGAEAIDEITFAGRGGADNVAMTVGVSGSDNVNIDGGDGADRMQYNGSAGGDQIAVIANGLEVSTTAPATTRLDTIRVEDLVVNALAGSDEISAVGNLAPLAKLSFDGGEDGDVIRGGNGIDQLLGGDGDDFVDGQQGNDVAFLGDGTDTFQWDPGDGSDTVEGQAGSDKLLFNGSNIGEVYEATADGDRVRFTRNIATIVMNLDEIEEMNLRAFGGTDTLTVNDLTGTDLAGIDVDLGLVDGSGDAAADTVIVNGSSNDDTVDVATSGSAVVTSGLATLVRIARSEAALDSLQVRTLDGDDSVTVAAEVAGLITPVIDLGPGE